MQSLYILDLAIYRAVNAYAGSSPVLDRVVQNIELFTTLLFVGIYGLLWHTPGKIQRHHRATLVLGLVALVAALVLNRTISILLPFRVRPSYAIGANGSLADWSGELEHWSSFPSDHGTFVFAITCCFWLVSRPWGAVFGLYGLFACLARVFVGVHYPSDIVAGALLGVATTLIINRPIVHKPVEERLLALEGTVPAYFYALLFVALTEAATGFRNSRRIAVVIVHLFQAPLT